MRSQFQVPRFTVLASNINNGNLKEAQDLSKNKCILKLGFQLQKYNGMDFCKNVDVIFKNICDDLLQY